MCFNCQKKNIKILHPCYYTFPCNSIFCFDCKNKHHDKHDLNIKEKNKCQKCLDYFP